MIRALVFLLGIAASAGVEAQLRSIPAQAKRGEMQHLQDMFVAINGKRMRLAAGAQIRDESNRIVVPAAIPRGARVKYTVDAQGDVFRVWILSRQER
ncbi:MAG: hypothetical protein HYX46_04950 [Betaproteobacteria bacterium]|nr:hypothetical protein [Betaproteobacteria bacterium]